MNENNKGSMIILTIIGIATLLVAVIGATFAYFTATVKGNMEETTVEVQTTNTMLITFNTPNKMEYVGAIPGRPTDPNVKNKLEFTLTSDEALKSATAYNVYLVIEENTFMDGEDGKGVNELVYLLNHSSTKSNIEEAIPSTVGDIKEVNPQEITLVYNDVPQLPAIKVNSIDSTTGTEDVPEEKLLIGSGVLGSHGAVDSWVFELWLQELQSEQNYNQGKTFKAHIEIEVVNNYMSNESITSKVTP